MNLTTSQKLKKLFLTMLAALLAFCLTFACACGKTSNDGDDTDGDNIGSIESATDYQTVANGDFEFYTDDKSYPYSSSVKWTRTTSSDKSTAPSSSKSSGIIDTSSDAYAKLDSGHKPYDTDNTTRINPHTPYFYGLIPNDYDEEDEEKRVNPNTAGSKILMIHNAYNTTSAMGTAQYFASSSTLSVDADGYGVISLWVKTENLKSKYLADNFGAYVSLITTVGSTSYKNVVLNNINTNGAWAKFSIYIKGDELTSATFNVKLGLGEGNGTNYERFVEGYAYFDNVTFATLSRKEFEEQTDSLTISNITKDTFINENMWGTYTQNFDGANRDTKVDYDKTAPSNKYTDTKVVYNFNIPSTWTSTANGTASFSTDVLNNNQTNIEQGNNIGVDTYANLATSNLTYANALNTIASDIPSFTNDKKVIYFDFANYSTASYETRTSTLDAGSFIRYTFYANVEVKNISSNALNVKIVDKTKTDSSKATTNLFTTITTDSIKNGNYGKWKKYNVYVTNPTDTAIEYSLKFVFGFDGAKITQVSQDLVKGFAFIADLSSTVIDEDAYASATTGDTLYKATLLGNYLNYSEEEDDISTDSYSINLDHYQKFAIQTQPVSDNDFKFKSDKTSTVSGIINTKYIDAYSNVGSDKDLIKSLTSGTNKYAQLLVINNIEDATSTIDISKRTLTANSYVKVMATLRVVGNATCYLDVLTKDDNGEFVLAELNGNDSKKGNLQVYSTKDDITNFTDKFITLTIYVASGNTSIDYIPRLTLKGEGTVYVEQVNTESSSQGEFDSDKEQLKKEYAQLTGYEFAGFEHTRANSTIIYTDDNGKEATKTQTYEPQEIYAGNNLVLFTSYATTYADTEIDETTPSVDDDEEDSEEESEGGYNLSKNVGLEIVSLILSIVLIIVLIVLFVRSIIKDRRKRAKTTKSYYDRDTREKAMKAISDKKNKIDVEDDDTEYDYSAAETVSEDGESTEEEIIDIDSLTENPDVVTEEPTDSSDDTDDTTGE